MSLQPIDSAGSDDIPPTTTTTTIPASPLSSSTQTHKHENIMYGSTAPEPTVPDSNNDNDDSGRKERVQQRWSRGLYYDWQTYLKGGAGTTRHGRTSTSMSSSDQEGVATPVSFLKKASGCWGFLRRFRLGYDERLRQSSGQIQRNMADVAQLLLLLREYKDRFGIPDEGNFADQEFVLREVTKDLYAGGCPIWALEAAMERAAEGLTGTKTANVSILPRKAFLYIGSSSTCMFRISRGFDIQKLELMERILVRLASYGTNTHGVASLPTRFPHPSELTLAYRQQSTRHLNVPKEKSKEELRTEILRLASYSEGLFFFVHSADRPDTLVHATMIRESKLKSSSESLEQQNGLKSIVEETSEELNSSNGGGGGGRPSLANANKVTLDYDPADIPDEETPVNGQARDDFWTVEDDLMTLFSRLAAIDTIHRIDASDKEKVTLYTPTVLLLFRFFTSFGACGIWFGGGWYDMLIAGGCGVLVGLIGTWKILSRDERIIYEAIASFFVGLIAGIVTLVLPDDTCFRAIGLAGIIDILQGFRVVYSVIEIMAKHTVSGGADFLEGILFTGLISGFLVFGQLVADWIMPNRYQSAGDRQWECTNPIDELWYILFVPLSTFCWSGLFNPQYQDLPLMALHGTFSYVLAWLGPKLNWSDEFSLFLPAVLVTFSAGTTSRFTGRNAIGNTISGLYVLVPGAYLVSVFITSSTGSFDNFGQVIFNSALIGVGAWSGTLLCSPTLLGATVDLIKQRPRLEQTRTRPASRSEQAQQQGAMIFF